MRLRKRGLLWGLAVIALAVLTAYGNEPINKSIKMPARESYRKHWDSSDYEQNDDSGFQRHIKITVAPATFPYPLLKHRLNICSTELEFGNAAPLYSQACEEFQKKYAEAEKNWYASNAYYDLKKSGASNERILAELFRAIPLEPDWGYGVYPSSLSSEEESQFYQSMAPVYRLLEKASRMRDADWSYQMEYKGIETNLHHIQKMRELARYLYGKSDWEIRNGRYEDAVKTIRVGIALGNHLSKANFPTLISMLVGVAIHSMMQNQIMDLESQPDAPNLYPALTQVVFPADSLQYALQGEQYWFIPSQNPTSVFENIDRASPEECRERLENVVTTFFQVQWMASFSVRNEERGMDKSKVAAAMTAICTLCYPQARDRLLERGRTAEEIDKLSVYQVVAPFMLERIKAAYDRMLVTMSFPAGSTHSAINFDDLLVGNIQSPVDIYLLLVTPAFDAARRAYDRQSQTHELLKITEAIRYYVAAHEGQLPESLDAIKDVPVATADPITGKPFGYKVEGRTALIDFTHVGKCRLEITVEEPAAQPKAGK